MHIITFHGDHQGPSHPILFTKINIHPSNHILSKEPSEI
jgi:hypothetical protein